MVYRVLTGLACLCASGCFSEPPSSGGDESSTSSGASSTSGEGSTSSGEEPSSGSSGEQESSSGSSGEPDTSSNTDEKLPCEDEPVATGTVPADVVIIVGEGSVLPEDLLMDFTLDTNVATILPLSVTAALATAEGISPECADGCDGCLVPGRVLVPYDEKEVAFDLFLGDESGDEFNCVFRPPPPDMSLSEPSRHLWLFIEDPEMDIPGPVRTKVVASGLRLHVACPGCGPEDREGPGFPGPETDLAQLVGQTNGTIADSESGLSLAAQLGELTARRTSCIWADAEPPPFLVIDNVFANELNSLASRIDGPNACDEVVEVEGEPEIFPEFYENGGDVQLCPFACRIAQLPPAVGTEVYRCE